MSLIWDSMGDWFMHRGESGLYDSISLPRLLKACWRHDRQPQHLIAHPLLSINLTDDLCWVRFAAFLIVGLVILLKAAIVSGCR